ncbi:hypothetical protein HBZS_122960 [Helicobacter bizzozeronii CCUG 35545]|nr:hypothetical protein HBZS_122960 [Helicobacter bizzozeronii CCUG 35545]
MGYKQRMRMHISYQILIVFVLYSALMLYIGFLFLPQE